MAGNKYIELNSNGALQEHFSVDTSAGAGDAGEVVALDSTGKIDQTMMPVGIVPDLANVVSFEDLNAGDFVNVFDNASTPNVRKADATTVGKEADGYVLAAVTAPATVDVYFENTNIQVSGQTIGAPVYLQTVAGTAGPTAPATSGNIVQRLGKAISATAVSFEAGQPITVA